MPRVRIVFSVRQLVTYVGRFMSLRPGDLDLHGHLRRRGGHGTRPPRYLQPGDVVEMGIDHLGVQRHVVAESRSARGQRAR
jgi:2,4-diketo-3-deoxy-L-fuconate hydrolase